MAGRQAERFGAELLLLRGVHGVHFEANGAVRLHVDGDSEVAAPISIAAPGMVWRLLEVEGVDELLDRGVYYGAGRSEAAQCGGDDVVVIGAGNSAGQAVLNLANNGARVLQVVRGDRLGKSMSHYLVERIEAHPLIDVRLRTEVRELHENAAGFLDAVTIETAGGARERRPARALFACLGGVPQTRWCDAAGVLTDNLGYILTGPDLLIDGRRREDWPWTATRSRSRPASRASSPPVTCATARSSASAARSARAPWRSRWHTRGARSSASMASRTIAFFPRGRSGRPTTAWGSATCCAGAGTASSSSSRSPSRGRSRRRASRSASCASLRSPR